MHASGQLDEGPGGRTPWRPAAIPVLGSPPLANRGVDTYESQTQAVLTPDKLVHEGFDWLTATLGPRAIEQLLAETEHAEHGLAQRGFGASSRRLCFGGDLWLKTEPRQASNRWGLNYASVEVAGPHAGDIVNRVLADDSKATRLDYANDFEVTDDILPEHVMQQFRPTFEALGITEGVSGQGGVNTRYIGSPKSERRIRIYRKDRRTDGSLAYDFPVLRVETIVKGHAAAAIWALSDRAAMVAAMNHTLLERTGLDLGGTAPAPPLPNLDDDAIGQRVFAFVKQHGRTLSLLNHIGVNLRDLAELAEASPSRMTAHRIHTDRVENAHIQPEELLDQVRRRLRI